MKPADLQTVARSIRARLVDYPPQPALGESLDSFGVRLADSWAAVQTARYVAAAHGGGSRFLDACGVLKGLR